MTGIDRRTKVYKDLVKATPKPEIYLEEIIDGVVYRYKPEPRCRVCSAEDTRKGISNGKAVKDLVDTLLLYPKSLIDVYRTIEPFMEDWPAKARISLVSIRTHLKKHLGTDEVTARMIVERRAQEKGIPILNSAGRMVLTEEAWLEQTAHVGWQKLISGDIEPTWAETQKAFERMSSIQQQAEGEYDIASLLSQLNTIIETMRDEVPPELWPGIVAKLEERGSRLKLPSEVRNLADEELDEELELDEEQLEDEEEEDILDSILEEAEAFIGKEE